MGDGDRDDRSSNRAEMSRRRFLGTTGGVVVADASVDRTPTKRNQEGDSSRVDELVERMTVEEKIGQMTQKNVDSLDPAEVGNLFADHHVGSLLSSAATPPTRDPVELAKSVNGLQRWTMENTRLGIPFLYGVDAVHGNNLVYDAPIFPHNVAVGATWSPTIAERLAVSTGESVRASGPHWTFAPANDVQRDPRWGRFYEGFSESPYLASELGAAKVTGYQASTDEFEVAVGACQKHFAGYSEPNNGNDRNAAHLPVRYLRDVHLPPHRAGIEAGAESVMVNSGSVNGVPAHASPWLLTDLLRTQMGFDGVVVSDWKDFKRMVTMHNYAENLKEATKIGVSAGVDVYMNPDDVAEFTRILAELVRDGEIAVDRIDEAVKRILQFKENLGLFDDPFVDPSKVEDKVQRDEYPEARRAASKAITLLQNRDETLPFDSTVRRVFVTGVRYDHPLNQMGGWTLGWHGLPLEEIDTDRVPAVTILEGLEDAAPSATEIVDTETIDHDWNASDGADSYAFKNANRAANEAANADAIVVVVGEGPYAEGGGDVDDLALPDAQRQLVAALGSTGTPVVGVVVAGRPRGSAVFDEFDAAVMAYQSGTATGTAVGTVLFDEENPSGHLPFRWPESTGQVGSVHNDPYPNDGDPRFEFGHGMSYTEFSYENLRVMPSPDALNVTVSVTNSGSRSGDGVVKVFATRDGASVIYPEKTLVGFDRLSLEPGETKRVTIEAPLSTLATVPGDVPGEADERIVPAGEYEVNVDELSTSFTVESRRS